MPPCFGVSSAAAGSARASAAARPAATRSANGSGAPRFAIIVQSLAGCRRCRLFVEPHRGQVLVEVMAWADLPALDVGMMRDDALPPQQEDLVRLVIERVLLELPHQRALLRWVRLAQHLLVNLERRLVLELAVIGLI